MRKALLITLVVLLFSSSTSPAFAFNPRYLFTDQEKDFESGLYNFDAREYNPSTGKFLQPDPVLNNLGNPQQLKQQTGQDLEQFLMDPQNLNPYSYTKNNPINYVDPTGESEVWAWILNPKLTAAQVSFWNGVANSFLKPQGMNISAYFLQHSLGLRIGNNLDLNIKSGNDKYNVIDTVKQSNEYKSFIQERINEADANEQTGFYFEGGKGTQNESKYLIFNDSDLKYSLHQSNIYITGQKLDNGKWDLNVRLNDTHDYDEFVTNLNQYQGDLKGIFGNNSAYISQNLGAISNYNINIQFNQTW